MCPRNRSSAGADPSSSGSWPGSAQQQDPAQEAARGACLLIAALLEIPYLRTSTLMALAATADLVPRLWFSLLRVSVADVPLRGLLTSLACVSAWYALAGCCVALSLAPQFRGLDVRGQLAVRPHMRLLWHVLTSSQRAQNEPADTRWPAHRVLFDFWRLGTLWREVSTWLCQRTSSLTPSYGTDHDHIKTRPRTICAAGLLQSRAAGLAAIRRLLCRPWLDAASLRAQRCVLHLPEHRR